MDGQHTNLEMMIDSMTKFLSQKVFLIKKTKICKTDAQKSSNQHTNISVKEKFFSALSAR